MCWRKHARLSLFCLGGGLCLIFAGHQYYYSQLIVAGNAAVRNRRFDTQAYERAGRIRLANQDRLLFNQGVLAYQAENLRRAAEYFREASRQSNDDEIRRQAFYNLGMVLLSLDEVKEASELFKETLRITPQDTDAKFNLERLYQFIRQQDGESGQASLEQAPGANGEVQEQEQGRGQGRANPHEGI